MQTLQGFMRGLADEIQVAGIQDVSCKAYSWKTKTISSKVSSYPIYHIYNVYYKIFFKIYLVYFMGVFFHSQHDTRNSPTSVCINEHWQNIAAGGLQDASPSSGTWTWHSQPNLWNTPLEAGEILKDSGWADTVMDLQTEIPPVRRKDLLVNHH